MKEKTVIITAEITRIVDGDTELRPVEDIKRLVAQAITDAVECDHASVAKVQVFEMDKES